MSDGLPVLMRAQIAAEMALTSPYRTDDPPKWGTYFTTCKNRDGAVYGACTYWHHEWFCGPFVTVLAWMPMPPLFTGVIDETL